MQLQLANKMTITITPATGMKLARVQAWFGVRFGYLLTLPPADEHAQRRVVTRIAKALAPYVRGATVEQLAEAFIASPYDMIPVVQAVLGGTAYTPKGKPR
jgi:hypothetical protein